MSGEFNLIDKYFVGRQNQRKDVHLAAGDDCALVKAPANVQIAISTDTLVAGTHFLPHANPAWVAHKALASNISDLAAMGATPAWVSFALTMPEADEEWLALFCDAFFELADYFGIQLIGGDTTKGPLSLTLTVQGFVPEGKALTRSGAKVGDWVYVTGNLGDAKAGLDVILDETLRSRIGADELEKAHYLSTPRVLAGQALVGLASSAIDISDGLISDIKHILKRSQVGVSIDVSQLPISSELVQFLDDKVSAQQYALSSGEEYELCFTVSEQNRGSLQSALSYSGCKVTCIGQIRPNGTFELHDNNQPLDWDLSGFDHFK
ncbi:thiamine-phosphate kinase [Vibrio parahaemolyticus]|uniref:thiamine-phosphate kinase n=1 Tax=Vibrio parahaemolyticus TaxID=670 RepID=UPI00040B6F89|nr:thiamine-phosphate kinase [Vibrio parahaemolyticus]KJR18763.1 thiamine monophosphate kinase [Vibrio parahaemolyticus]HCE2692374.1 thiamine-phosphate kinase [Vibrio parahaemolyticus]HCE2693981.1 thiamine-phosphate kinase [Vibrio parahaemolyticus]HCE2917406.1 thiamine-phosphate kinase [Vibrio parahaemolyticus]HCE2918821.1 thiamine-phosphate kinase [Vibrio parahaemolyticus]